MMRKIIKQTDMKIYTEDGQELGTAEIELISPTQSNTVYIAQYVTAITDRLMDIKRGSTDYFTTVEATAAIKCVIDNRAVIPYWALQMLMQYAGLDITEYKWAPVDQKPYETLEHAYRRVQLSSTVVRDNTYVVLIPSAEYNSSNSDTLF